MEQSVTLGMREDWGQETPVVLHPEDRRHHVYTLGKSGSGKTTLLRNLILQDIAAGRGVGVIDPHGDLASDLLEHVPRNRIEDTVYFNAADEEYPIGLNLLRPKNRHQNHLVTSGLVSVFKSLWSEFWGPRLEYILSMTLAALLDCEGVSLLGIQRMLSDPRYRAWVLRQVDDPIVRLFWTREFEAYGKQFLQEAIAPIQNKVGQLLMSSQLRNILGQVRSRIDARFMMDNGRILIADVSKGKLGADKSNLLGALLVTQFQVAAMCRADVPEDERRDFFLYVDEFQSFASDSFISILSEARKYRLCLTLAHQYIDQLRPTVRDAVFGNVGSMIVFRVGEGDAQSLEREFGNACRSTQFTSLSNYEVCAKLLNGGRSSEPFVGRTLARSGTRHNRMRTIVRRSREKYSAKRHIVENKINKWLG